MDSWSELSSSEKEPPRKLPNVAIADLETDPFKKGRIPKVFAAGWADHTGTIQTKWGTQKAVLDWITEKIKKYEGLVYFHNGGKFDFLGYIVKHSPIVLYGERARVIGGRIVACRFGAAEVRDSYAILPAKLGSYDKGEIDYALFEKEEREKYRAEILEYLIRDCRSLREIVLEFLSIHGPRPLTAASAGFAHLKSLGYEISKMSESQDAKYRKWYFGGRVSAFKPGIHQGSFKLYDIKSAYPHAMLSQHASGTDFEFISGGKEAVRGPDFILCQGESGGHIMEKRLRVSKTEQDPGARLGMYVTGWEYLEMPDLWKSRTKIVFIERPIETSSYERYVNYWYEQKADAEKKGNPALRHIAKIMLNSAYGKFAQRPDRFRDYAFMPDDEPTANGWQQCYLDSGNKFAIWEKPSTCFNAYWNVATAASITGYVRARLIKAIYETDPFYCDTDSIICGENKNPSGLSENLGGWSLEVEGDKLYIGGKKLYAFRVLPKYCSDASSAKKKGYYWDDKEGRGWKIASKGVRLSPNGLFRVCMGETVEWENEAPTFSIKSDVGFVKRKIKMTS